jgi:hypothetical protein
LYRIEKILQKFFSHFYSIGKNIMANRTQIKTTFAPAKVIQPLYTRGSVALSQDGRILASCLDDDVLLTDLRTGEELARIEGVGIPPSDQPAAI